MMKHMVTLDEAANAAEGRIVSRAAAENSVVTIDGVSKDTRTIRPGDIYVAIKGENFDGHDYCISAVI
jgi:UDP-N-acetylmuramoyl-tripeptide--D-alanyl-D-alanine ligase